VNKRQGFTLIELIVVITIIGVLLGMLVVGINYVSASSHEKATRVTLANLQSMLAELESSGGLDRLMDLDGDGEPDGAVMAPGQVMEPAAARTGEAVQRTRNAMAVLLAIPANQSVLAQLPGEQQWVFPEGTRNQSVPVLLDAWRNPIIFVPPPAMTGSMSLADRYGLRGLKVEGFSGTYRMLNPDGLDEDTGGSKYPQNATEAAQKLPHYRPFWVSAGPDGDFQTHDDNIYSFEN